MKTCPQCFKGDNPADATTCLQCNFSFDRTADLYHRSCPSGKHQMDPTWAVCAFCKAEGVGAEILAAGSGTVDESSRRPGAAQGAGPASQGGRRTQLDADLPDLHLGPNASGAGAGRVSVPGVGVKKTVLGGGMEGVAPAAGDKRRIVGMLVTYTWEPEGQIFAVREGRNRIGRDRKQCDIVIEQDETLSAENTSIAFRSKFVITDKDSMGGTYVNGKAVEEASFPLSNYCTIRAGSTTFTFIAVNPWAEEANS